MEMDEKLRWLETRITSSLRPRQEELKTMFSRDDNRIAFHEFMSNEDVRKLYVYVKSPKSIVASLKSPTQLKAKSVFFMKMNEGVKLTKENIGREVYYVDCSDSLLEHMDTLTRDIFMPMLCMDSTSAQTSGPSQDRAMDVLHRLTACVETTDGHVKGEIILPLPSIEVLAEAADAVNRRVAVLHVLESTVIGWIKQIKGIIRHDPVTELNRRFGKHPGPLDEVQLWKTRLEKLQSINEQLDLQVSQDILINLEQADSQYAQSFNNVRKDIDKAVDDTEENLCFLRTMMSWFEQLHEATEPDQCMRLFPPMVHTLMLVWTHSRYYHQKAKFHNLLRVISNEIVDRARNYVGEDILNQPLESYSKLREALRICASFRGTYLDERDRCDVTNAANVTADSDKATAQAQGPMWNVKMYGPFAYVLSGSLPKVRSQAGGAMEDTVLTDSPWPPRNAPCFAHLNSFMERCNDVLELVETTRHFELLSHTAEVGGAGSVSLDSLVREIHQNYMTAMAHFFSVVDDVLKLDAGQSFERAFFTFRTIVKGLERRLADVLRHSFEQCPSIGSQLRLLEVFEGVSSRELVQAHLKDKDAILIRSLTDEVLQVRALFRESGHKPPEHSNMPVLVSKLYWIHALTERLRIPMETLRHVSPASLDGDVGWQLRDTYTDAVQEMERYKTKLIADWEAGIESELPTRLKQPLLTVDYKSPGQEETGAPSTVRVNLDQQLVLLLREIRYLTDQPFLVQLPRLAREMVRNTSAFDLQVMAARLDMIASKYNSVIKHVTDVERPLFDRKLAKIEQLFEEGLSTYTWQTEESADFIEMATSLVCWDVHRNLDTIQTTNTEVVEMTKAWMRNQLDIFAARDAKLSYSIDELEKMASDIEERLHTMIVPMGYRIHSLVDESFKAAELSEASPAWEDYLLYIDNIVLEGLKQCAMTSLRSMLDNLVQSNADEVPQCVPILTIRLELVHDHVTFRPPLDNEVNITSVQETARKWLSTFIGRGDYCPMLSAKESYRMYLDTDRDVISLREEIDGLVEENAGQCLKFFTIFSDYQFLWEQDVNQTFEDFLRGQLTPNPLRPSTKSEANKLRRLASAKSAATRTSSAKSSIETAGILGTAEREFLTPKRHHADPNDVPSLDDFDCEIEIYKIAKDEIAELQDYENVGWLRVDFQPIKQLLTMYAEKCMWTYTEFLTNKVTELLTSLDGFLVRIEPEIESITGDEKDTASFMKMMRLFNEVSAQQNQMDGKFAAMRRTVQLLEKYGQKLPEQTHDLFLAAPGRWNSLRTKVSLAKQRLGPRIQEESVVISQDLTKFSERVHVLHHDLSQSSVFSRDCDVTEAWPIIEQLNHRLREMESEAEDLFQLQELLEVSIVNFSILPQCRRELDDLRLVWNTAEKIYNQQREWNEYRWQKLSTKFLREESTKQLNLTEELPEQVTIWDVYLGLRDSILRIQACLPLMDDLSHPAMRTRHWKQLVRATGDPLQMDNDTIKRMTLGELFHLGLQSHKDDVRAIIQRAVKDLSIENSLKFYEEVWLSKIFELKPHVGKKATGEPEDRAPDQDRASDVSDQSASKDQPASSTSERKSATKATSRASLSSYSRTRRHSVSSLPGSLVNLTEDLSDSVSLLRNTRSVFDELESHQTALQSMQSGSMAGSFLDEVVKWQKRLQNIEAVLTVWLAVQDKWAELEDIFSHDDTKTALSHDAHRFSVVNKDFRLLMRATEKNPNVLICCSRRNVQGLLEKMEKSLEHCYRSLFTQVERRRQQFPRFYFLSVQDVLHIVCNGYNPGQVNPYISKVLENVGALVYEETPEHETCNYQMSGLQSVLGERLVFTEPIACSGQIESWLTQVLQMIRSSLQAQLKTALCYEKPKAQSKASQSAGTRPVSVTSQEHGDRASEKSAGSRRASRPLTRRTPVNELRTPEPARSEVKTENDQSSWMLEHITEVVVLSTQIQISKRLEEAMNKMADGGKDALQVALDKLDEMLEAAVMMLRGFDTAREKRSRLERGAIDFDTQRETTLKEQSEVSSEVGGAKTGRTHSMKGSNFDLTATEELPSPIPEATETDDEDGSRAPVDTMNLSLAIPDLASVTKSHEETLHELHDEEQSDYKLVLLPSQIHKITTVISVVAHKRELLGRVKKMMEEGGGDPVESFDWASQLRFTFTEESKDVHIKCLDMEFDYGFEYQGNCEQDPLSYCAQQVHVTLLRALKNFKAGMCVGPSVSGSLEVVQGLARALAQPLYTFNFPPDMDINVVQNIFKGLALTGAWICFANLSGVLPSVMNLFGQMLAATFEALANSKSSVALLNDEVPLAGLVGACLAVEDSRIRLSTTNDPDRTMLLDSAVAKLPECVLAQFRVVAMATPDVKLLLEIQLLSQGFLNARELANKLSVLHTTTTDIISLNQVVTQHLKLEGDQSESALGWSPRSMKRLCIEAGALLDHLHQKRLSEQEYKQQMLEEESLGEEEETSVDETKPADESTKLDGDATQETNDTDLTGNREDEDEAVVTALRNSFLPRLQVREASVFTTLVYDLWPDVRLPMTFGGVRTLSETDVTTHGRIKSSGSLTLNTPVVTLPQTVDAPPHQTVDEVVEDIEDAIAIATHELGLMPGASFQARVSQLAQLNVTHRTIIVVGPPGCGKSEMIKTFAVAEKTRGKTMDIQSVFTKAVEAGRLFGEICPETREWTNGLIPTLLQKLCIEQVSHNKPSMKILQLDGGTDARQMDVLESVLLTPGPIVLPNSERLVFDSTLRFIWELESLSDLGPSLLASVGVLCMTYEDVGWELLMERWTQQRPDSDRDVIKSLCKKYVSRTMVYLSQCTRPPVLGGAPLPLPQYSRIVQQSDDNMISTLSCLFEAVTGPFSNLSEEEIERYFAFSLVWSLAATLHQRNWDSFSAWFDKQFPGIFPSRNTVFDYLLDADTRTFVRWSDTVAAYSSPSKSGIPPDAFVHTATTERVSYLLGLLSDMERPVMIIGERGCGKTSIVADRLKAVCSGEVAEYLGLTINTNRFTHAAQLYGRLDDRLEWKHGRTYIPKGNKRLMCFIDDLNMAQVDRHNNQTAVELVREHIDDQGFYSPDTHRWRYVNNVSYITTVNPAPTATVPALSARVVRHFALIPCTYPDNQELQTVYRSLLLAHFVPSEASVVMPTGLTAEEKARYQQLIRGEGEELKSVLSTLICTTVELQDRLRRMYLPIAQRVHYVFNMKNLGTVFSNLCLSLTSQCSIPDLLSLWRAECQWAYRQRMGDSVDRERFDLVFSRAVKKHFSHDSHIQVVTDPAPPVFSSIRQQESGIIRVCRRGHHDRLGANQEDDEASTDGYLAVPESERLRSLLEEAVDEFNKVNPQIRLHMYESTMTHVCRLARTITSNHVDGQTVIVSDGSPGLASIVIKLASHVSGYKIFRIHTSPMAATEIYKLDHFKADLANGFCRAGVKGEKLLFLLHEEELADDDFLVFVQDFIISTSSITNLFTSEEQTTIINSIRTEVTQAGLTYTRDVAWEFFIRTVSENFRVCIVESQGGPVFQRHCREFPALTQNVNFIWMEHWEKKELIRNALHLLKDVSWMSGLERENIAHMLANMHLFIRQQDPSSCSYHQGEQQSTSGEYNHLTNTTYEKFVERYVSLANTRRASVEKTHAMAASALSQIRKESTMAERLHNQLKHEKVVFEEKKAGTVNMLAQIGQDTAITEQQIKIVKAQQEKIKKLKKLLPEYQVAHERAVYKASNVVADTKRNIKSMNPENLEKLRTMQKPMIDIEDLMAAVIIILKSPSSDLTWQKGAKRQLSNLERFVEELLTFDDMHIPESTLQLVEAYLKKPSFEPDTLERKTGNSACKNLAKWLHGVANYHRMMISRVKPLHTKVDEMMQSVNLAEHKMASLDHKRKCLEERLADLQKGFEEATVDKNNQEEKTVKMTVMLKTSARLRKIIKSERKKYQQIYESRTHRIMCIPGSVAMAAGFLSYLGPYHYRFRRCMLTIHWPRCLLERGVPLVLDSVDTLKGRIIDWSLDLPGISTVGEVYSPEEDSNHGNSVPSKTSFPDDVDPEAEVGLEGEGEEEEQEEETESQKLAEDISEKEKDHDEEKERASPIPEQADEGGSGPLAPTPREENQPSVTPGASSRPTDEETPGDGDSPAEDGRFEYAESEMTLPVLSPQEYGLYVRAMIQLIVGRDIMVTWSESDLGLRQLENAALIASSWQRPTFVIDSSGDGLHWLRWLNRSLGNARPESLDMDLRSDPQMLLTIEKSILRGNVVLLENCRETMDNDIMPLVYHQNFMGEHPDPTAEPKMIRFCDRRILCHNEFQLYLSTRQPKPAFSPETASMTQLVNYGIANETLTEDLLSRTFARLRPELYLEKRKALNAREQLKAIMNKVIAFVRLQIYKTADTNVLWNEDGVEKIAETFAKKDECLKRWRAAETAVDEANRLRDELSAIARRGAVLYGVIRSLVAIRPEYEFSLEFFLQLFDKAVGSEPPEEFYEFMKEEMSVADVESKEAAATNNQSEEETEKEKGADKAEDGEEDTFIRAITDARDQESRLRVIEQIRGIRGTDAIGRELNVDDGMMENLRSEAQREHHDTSAPEDHNTVEKIPTEGVEYTSLPDEQVHDLVTNLTSLVYNTINISLYEEDRLLFATLVCLRVNSNVDDDVMTAELSLLTRGNPGLNIVLSLSDFNCRAEVPKWLPTDVWEEILSVSVLTGTLSNLCVDVAEHPEVWETWFTAACPEDEAIPLRSLETGESGDEGEGGDDNHGSRTDLYHLIIIRLLRPDRFPLAMAKYVSRHLTLAESEPPSLNEITNSSANQYHGILVLLPPGGAGEHLISSLKAEQSTSSKIEEMAKSAGVSLEVIRMQPHQPIPIDRVLESCEKEDGWLLIEDLHLGTTNFYQELVYHLVRKFKSRESLEEDKRRTSKFCVWVTCQPGQQLPANLLHHLHKVCWDHVTDKLMTSSTPLTDGEQTASDLMTYNNLDGVLASVIPKVLRSLPARLQSSVTGEQVKYVFGLVVIHSVLSCRQHLGSRGLAQWTHLGLHQVEDGIEIVRASLEGGELLLDDVCAKLAKIVYGNYMSQECDRRYVTALVYDVMNAVHQSESSVVLGSVEIPIPTCEDILSAADSCEESIKKKSFQTLEALSLSTEVEREWNHSNSLDFVRRLDRLVRTNQMDCGEVAADVFSEMNMLGLRAALDLCRENLPPFLELGDAYKIGVGEEEPTFPYHCPSVLSFSTASSSLLPETLGFVLLQECLWYNRVLRHVRQTIHDLRRCLLSGRDSIPHRLTTVAMALQQEHVPMSWTHVNRQPAVHTLLTWLNDMCNCHEQMYSWVKYGLIPSDGHTASPRGQLKSLWLGGLVNPQAVFTALRQEKAALANCLATEVSLRCEAVAAGSSDRLTPEAGDASLVVHQLHVEGAGWDVENNCLQPDSADLNLLPSLCIKAVKSDDSSSHNIFYCPVFMNKSRQVCVTYLPLLRGVDESTLLSSGTAILVDAGVPHGVVRHSKSLRHLQNTGQLLFTPRLVDYETDSVIDEQKDIGDSSLTVSKQYSSQQSQLSYKEFTPKASPLPPSLQLTRGDRLVEEDDETGADTQRTDNTEPETETDRTEAETGRSQSTDSPNGNQNAAGSTSDQLSTREAEKPDYLNRKMLTHISEKDESEKASPRIGSEHSARSETSDKSDTEHSARSKTSDKSDTSDRSKTAARSEKSERSDHSKSPKKSSSKD